MGSRHGNLVWRVETPDGPVVVKRYAVRNSRVAELARALLTGIGARKSLPTARGRRRAELALLRHWHAKGLDVPRVWEPSERGLGDRRCLILEWIEGPTLRDLLRPRAHTPRDERDRLLALLGAEMGRRHRRAVDEGDPRLIQEHGGAAHVIVSGPPGAERLVRFDHEQGFLPGQPVLPLVAKELLGTLRGLAKLSDGAGFADDLAAWLAGYDEPGLLAEVLREVEHSPSALRRALWAWDKRAHRARRTPHKFSVLADLRAALLARGVPARVD